ncbi:autotransporter outer membrane beta-barrel domain-containing protein [Helicobacter brantae]|uniref:Autotransporter domain-containing protein n=1 Tax=Helicobacter brantae TaxID=375927 RepID=A0A3D8J5C6_9HELI|nr:autotransporter outer membrane beta-barrel domain-containing protein [Helicobacter brantae]RDU72104.1 hypothetical protein CQA58_00425 [Helicobacter brantae]
MKTSFPTKSQKNGVGFKPLIATSLALALGMSVGNASNGQAPSISFGSNTTQTPTINWLGSDGYYKMSHNNGSALDNFTFYLETSSNHSTTTTDTTSTSYTAHISTSVDSLTLSTTSNGIQMGENGTGTLTIGGGNKSNGHSKDMTLNLHNLLDSNHYAFKGNLSIDNWQTGGTTAKIGGKGIKGNVTLKAVAGTNTFTFNNNAGIEGNLILRGGNHNITFGNNTNSSTTPHTPTITGNIQATGGNTTIKGLTTLTGNLNATSGNTTIKGLTTLEGNISVSRDARSTIFFSGDSSLKSTSISLDSGEGGTVYTKNQIIFNGSSAKIGEEGKTTDITITLRPYYTGASWQHSGTNTILSNASSNTFSIGNFKTSGNYGGSNPQAKTLNILSLNSSSNNISINTTQSSYGNNIIGKNLVTTNNADDPIIAYNSTLFGSNTPTIQNGFFTEFIKSTHSAEGTFVFGANNNNNSIIANANGKNYININGDTTIKGNILSSVSSSSDAIRGHNNLIVLTGTSAKLGESDKAISIKVNNSGGNPYERNSNNTLLLGASSNSVVLTEISAIGTTASRAYQNFNALSFNNSDTTPAQTLGAIKANYGSNIIGANLITQENGYDTAIFGNATNPSIQQDNMSAIFTKDTYTAKGTFSLASISVDNTVGGNYINVENINISDEVKANATGIISDNNSYGQKYADNIIYTNGSGTNSIQGNIIAESGSYFAYGRNIIIFAGEGENTFGGNISASVRGINSFTLGGNSTFEGNLSTTGGENNIALSKSGTTLTLKGATNQITTLTALASIDNNVNQCNTLILDSTNSSIATSIDTLENGNNLKINFKGGNDKSITLTLKGFENGNANIRSVSASSGTNNTLAFNQSATIMDQINSTSVASGKGLTLQVNSSATLHTQGGIDKGNGGAINVALNGGTLTFGTSSNHISNLSGNGVINLNHTPNTLQATQKVTNDARLRNSLTIDSFTSGEATFKLFASSIQNDRVIFNGGNNGAKAIITLIGESDIHDIAYSSHLGADNTLVAQTKNGSGIVVEGGESLIGIDRIKVELITTSDNQITNYYVGKIIDLGVDPVFQEMANTALMINYDLFLANFNSLNKRMGELRENDSNHGVWARIFGGSTSHSFGAGGKSDYVTIQGGYDYSIEVGESARNYMGIALAYGSSSTKSKMINITANTSLISSIGLDNISSNIIEVGLYNSYVADSGWYNDTILKFDYILSKFSMSNNSSSMNKIKNFATILSDEFGYRYKFAENEKGNWYIDPQVEISMGYFNQSDFARTIFDSSSELYAYQDAIFTLRTRAGASLGKKFNTENGFATLYAGAFYECDYIKGGDLGANGGGSQTIAQLDRVESNGRAIVNVGSNIELTKGARMYIDVEKSFGDKQRVHMQFNLGARYSF